MTVKELIEKLQNCKPEAFVYVWEDSYDGSMTTFFEVKISPEGDVDLEA